MHSLSKAGVSWGGCNPLGSDLQAQDAETGLGEPSVPHQPESPRA